MRLLKAGSDISLDSHHINHISSFLTITPKLLKIEKNHVKNTVKEMANISAKILNQYIIKFHSVFTNIW